VDKADKNFLFFWDFVVRYVRFWSSILSILTRQTAWRASAEKGAMSTDFDADSFDYFDKLSMNSLRTSLRGFLPRKSTKMHKRNKKMTKKVLFLVILTKLTTA